MDEALSHNAKTQNIKSHLDALKELQRLDDEIILRNNKIQKLKEQAASEDKAINHLRTTLDERKRETEELLKERRQAEVTVKQKTEEAQKMSGQLYEVKTNDAYTTLQHEIQQKKKENSLLEERILEMMVAEDELKATVKQAEAELKQGEQQVSSTQGRFQQEIGGLEKEIAQYQSEWDLASKNVRADYLDLYQRLRKSKGGKAMARIENDVCTGCQLSIRPQAAIELQKYRSLLYCDNCARILYVD